MARKRMIDPGIWTDIKFVRLTMPQRLLFIGLFSNADDDGRLRGEPEFLKMIIFPSDNLSPTAIVDLTKSLGDLIVRYEVDGKSCIQLKNWNKHQYIRDHRPSTIPPPKGYTPASTPASTIPTPNTTQHNTNQTKPKQQNTTQTKQIGDVASKGFKVLLSVGVGMDVASKLAATYDENTIMCAVRYARDNNVKNPAGYVVSCLRKGYV